MQVDIGIEELLDLAEEEETEADYGSGGNAQHLELAADHSLPQQSRKLGDEQKRRVVEEEEVVGGMGAKQARAEIHLDEGRGKGELLL